MKQYDAHVHYYKAHKGGFQAHILNGRAVGRYIWEWFIGLSPIRH